jgi:hypothetical protein
MMTGVYTESSAPPKRADLLALVTLEYEQLKGEQVRRIGARDGLVYAALAAVAAVTGASVRVGSVLLLVLPPALWLLGWTYLANDRQVSRIGAYIRADLVPRTAALLPGAQPFGWECWHRQTSDRCRFKTGQLAVDLAAFCLPAVVAVMVLLGHHPAIWAVFAGLAELAVTAVLADQIAVCADLAGGRSAPGEVPG